MGHRSVLVALGLALGLAACADSGTPQCAVGADCASGACRANGTCVPVDGEDAGPVTSDAGDEVDGALADAGTDPVDATLPPTDGSLGCSANRDGVIGRAEIPLRAGLRATFRVATDVAFDTSGTDLGDGRRRWDLTGPFAGDESVLVETVDPAGAWYADDFPGATYVTGLSVSTDLLGVFAVKDDALELLGVVSPDDGFDRTNLENDPAVPALRFPLERGDTWTTDTTVTGTATGVFSTYSEEYVSEVDAEGELVTSFGTFDVLRVRTELTRTVGVVVTRIVSFAFVAECFGTVATLRGADNETGEELSEVAELRRLVP